MRWAKKEGFAVKQENLLEKAEKHKGTLSGMGRPEKTEMKDQAILSFRKARNGSRIL